MSKDENETGKPKKKKKATAEKKNPTTKLIGTEQKKCDNKTNDSCTSVRGEQHKTPPKEKLNPHEACNVNR